MSTARLTRIHHGSPIVEIAEAALNAIAWDAALQRQTTVDAETIRVDTSGSTVTLSGDASNWQAAEDATSVAWAARA